MFTTMPCEKSKPHNLSSAAIEYPCQRCLHQAPAQLPRWQVDAQRLAQAFAKQCFRSVLAVNEFVTLALDGAVLAFRVTAAHTLDAAAREVTFTDGSDITLVSRHYVLRREGR